MIKRSTLQTVVLGLISALTLGSMITVMTAYYVIKKFTKRPVYSVLRQQEHEKNRELLLKEFKAQPLTFQTIDGITLSGLLLVREQAQRNLLVCHGYRMSKERMSSFATMFPNHNIFLFDYRAHGESQGDYTTIGYNEKKDVLGALSVLKSHEKTKDLPIFAIGVSMGAVSLLAAACESPEVKGLVLDSPFLRLDEQANRIIRKRYNLPIFPFAAIGQKMFEYLMSFSLAEVNSLLWAQHVKSPTFIIHSMKDDTAPMSDATTIYDSLTSQKDLWLVHESGHARIFSDFATEYSTRVNNFFDQSWTPAMVS